MKAFVDVSVGTQGYANKIAYTSGSVDVLSSVDSSVFRTTLLDGKVSSSANVLADSTRTTFGNGSVTVSSDVSGYGIRVVDLNADLQMTAEVAPSFFLINDHLLSPTHRRLTPPSWLREINAKNFRTIHIKLDDRVIQVQLKKAA